MTEHTFDLVVLGGGSGGYAAALRAAELGKSVALVERDRLGGTCLHRGCIPTKALLHAAEVADTVRSASTSGVQATLGGFDPIAMIAHRRSIVDRKTKGLEGLIARRGITVVAGSGSLTSDRAVRVGDDLYRGTDIVLATGSFSRTIPGIELGERIITSDAALTLERIPERVIVLGGGVIGVEFASAWRSLGAEVTIVEGLDRLVPNEDATLSASLERAFRRRGIVSKLGARVASAVESADGVRVTLEGGDTLEGDTLLVAVGRGPATSGLGLEHAGVALERGFVVVDESLRTNVPGVWAVGDITPGLQLAHRGFQQGIFVAEQIAQLAPAPIDERLIPRVTYSSPELASVGITQAAAEELYGAEGIKSVEFDLAGNARSEILGTRGLVKVIRKVDGPVVGVHLVGDRVGELITEGQLAVAWDAHPEDIAPLIHAHPTQSEALGEAFLALAGKPLHSL
ncbi:dihydrolipoyl dehydrogenase [Microbacterium sediminis]|uniref:Dihydrolipoyl dehydrogenase n=1 Tax=Microbacterium sediminis TaxID=904291 RepID=A0A1B9N911_9MICO|nr:dihydrolipoyl dehydrogenase [Microbacterium sediminis]OCG73083.1 dihydrolipoyl dehydrogenase [Microbacterium sediminis]QBR74431.1 dihydrolipoyl dehydrogenase [Microbacterium sediminis]